VKRGISSGLASAALLAFGVLTAHLPARAALFGDDVARKGVADQAKRIDDIRSQTDTLSARLSKIEEATRGTQATQQSMLELVNQIESLKREIQNLRGQIEIVNNGVENNAKRQRDMYVDLDTRMRRVEQGPSAPTGAAPPDVAAPPLAAARAVIAPTTAPSTAPTTVSASTADETRNYEAAQQQRRVGNYQGAITSFQSFLAQYPRSPLAHRAQYWIGDSYFNLRDYRNAITSQQKLVATYPDSASAPDALLNIASSQSELGESANARKTMDTLVARYPGSEAAEKAKRRLTTLR
jgi:tol-pal system protein YbgF